MAQTRSIITPPPPTPHHVKAQHTSSWHTATRFERTQVMLCEDVELKGWGGERAGGVMMHNWGARVFIPMK